MRRRSAALAVATALAFPAGAAAQESGNTGTDCSYATSGAEEDRTVSVGSGTVTVYAGSGGLTGTADVVAGACVNGLGVSGFDGGAVEAGAGSLGAYAVADGSNRSSGSLGVADGYFGVSNYETGSNGTCSDPDGDGDEEGTGSNSGGCTGTDATGTLEVGVLACGNTGGNTWNNTTRDGCTDPLLD